MRRSVTLGEEPRALCQAPSPQLTGLREVVAPVTAGSRTTGTLSAQWSGSCEPRRRTASTRLLILPI